MVLQEDGMSGLERFQEHLRELFQLDTADLDFGIYRMFAARREEVERFIEQELPASVDAAFADLLDEESKGTEERLQELTNDIVSEAEDHDAILPDGTIKPECKARAGKTLKSLIAEYEALRQKAQERSASEEQKDDAYNHLYAFFSRYYDDGDFIPRHFFGARNRYVVPYNGEETLFHWANRDQYYIKSGEHFRDYAFQVDTVAGPWRIQFKIVEASTPPGNTKGDTRFFFPQPADAEVESEQHSATVPFHYRLPTEQEVKRYGPKSKGQAAVLQEAGSAILKAIPDPMLAGVLAETVYQTEKETLTLIDKRLRHFTRKNTTDFFVHKRLREFLLDELEFYIRDQVVHLMDMDADAATLEKKRLSVRVFRRLAERIIDFLARIEDAQKTLFEKKKFALATDYLVPIEHVPENLRAEVLSNKLQIDQWKDWFSIKPKKDLFNQKGEINQTFLGQHPTLTVDTRCFSSDFKLRLLCALSDRFGDLDEVTDGLLIHSENFQALNYLLPRYEGEVKCIYIDPPYNTGQDGFVYKDKYQNSSWISSLENRLKFAPQLLCKDGILFVSIDDIQVTEVRSVCLSLFGKEGFIAQFVWKSRQYLDSRSLFRVSNDHEYALAFGKSDARLRGGAKDLSKYRNPDNDPRGPWMSRSILGLATAEHRPNLHYPLIDPETGLSYPCPAHTGWRYSEESMKQRIEASRILFPAEAKGRPREKVFLNELQDEYTGFSSLISGVYTAHGSKEIRDLFSELVLQFPKPAGFVSKIVQQSTTTNGLVLDHFAGSGTTGHAVINLNREDGGRRKFILVEMGDYFNTVLVPRIAKVMYTPEWKDGKPKRMATQEEADRTPRLVKILKLESYEDALHNLTNEAQIKNLPEPDKGDGGRRISYVLERLLEKTDSMLDWEALDRPFDYAMEVLTDDGVKTAPVDLVETFNALYGLRVQRVEIWQDAETSREYRVIKAAKADKGNVLVVWRNVPPEKEAARDRAFLEERIGDLGQWNEAWINGPCAVPGLKPLDGMFKRLITGSGN